MNTDNKAIRKFRIKMANAPNPQKDTRCCNRLGACLGNRRHYTPWGDWDIPLTPISRWHRSDTRHRLCGCVGVASKFQRELPSEQPSTNTAVPVD